MSIIRDKFGNFVGPRNGLPMLRSDSASRLTTVTGEAVPFIVGSTNVADAGSAAGTIVYAQLVNSAIQDSLGNTIGTKTDSSVAFTSGLAFTNQVDFPWEEWQKYDYLSRSARLTQVTQGWANGDYAIDYITGLVIGVKATTDSSDTVAYKYRTSVSAGGSVASTVAISQTSTDNNVKVVNGVGADSVNIKDGGNSITVDDAALELAAQITQANTGIIANAVKQDGVVFVPGVGLVMLLGAEADETSPASVSEGQSGALRMTLTRFLKVSMGDLIAGEDLTNNVLKTEERFSYSAVAVVDTQVKASAGFLHAVTISCNDAAPTAGSLIIYDNTAESGTVVFNHTFTTTPFVPFTIILDCIMTTGIYVGMTTTGDVNFSCSYR